MIMINAIKKTLSNYLNDAATKLSDEDISMLSKIKEDGLSSILANVVKAKNFNSISLINIAYALNTNNESIKLKIKEDNKKIINELYRVENDRIYTDVINKFYEPKNANYLKVVTRLSDVDTYLIDAKALQAVPFIEFSNRFYINPYNNGKFELKSKVEQGSNINSFKDPEERDITATITMALLSQNNWLEHSGKDNAGLSYKFSEEQISRMFVEFLLFHELSHASARKYILEGKDDEAFADICGIIQVVKNNDLSQEDAMKFVNRVILYRSQPSSIVYYSTDFENNVDNIPLDRYHFTQDSLIFLREMFETSFDKIKEMPITEQAIFAANLVRTHGFYATNDNIKDRLGLYGKESTNLFLDDLLSNEKDYIEKLADFKKIPVDDLLKRIKQNVSNDPRKILDLNLHIIYKHDEPTLYEIPSFSALDGAFLMQLHQRSVEDYKEIKMDRNFTYSELVKELDKHDIKRKPKL